MDGGTERNGEAGNAIGDAVFKVCFRVTGMVAADDDVPSAVK